MPAESTLAVDMVSNAILFFSIATMVGITGTIIYFVVRYGRKRNPRATDIRGNVWLELAWFVVPTLIGLAMFYYGLTSFSFITADVPGAMSIEVDAFQYGWQYRYANGVETDELRVPVGADVLLRLTSEDVIHSFYAPAFRIKMDAVPGMITKLHFKATEVGSYDVLCAEYCGIAHSSMLGVVTVMPQEEYDAWYETAASASDKM